MKRKKVIALFAVLIMAIGALGGCNGQEKSDQNKQESKVETDTKTGDKPYDGVKLTMQVENGLEPAGYEAVIELAKEKLGIEVAVETRSSGDEGNNIVKTRLASGDMADICVYSSGAMLAALNPGEYFIDMTDSEAASALDDNFIQAASVDGVLYGVPLSSSSFGGVMYNKDIYEKYDLQIPVTWDEFMENCDTIKEAGDTALIGSFGENWTSQVPFLVDNYELLQEEPDFPEKFTQGTVKYADSKAGVRSWEKLTELTPYYNADYLATNYNDACDMLVNGEGAHYIMTSAALRNIYTLYGDKVNDIGFFAYPGDEEDKTGVTIFTAAALYGNKDSDNVDAVKAFMEWWLSDEAIDAYVSKVLPDGPFHNGYQLPEDAFDAVKDSQKYIEEGRAVLAIEALSPVKGANCPALCQELGSGQSTPEETAKAYDEDCKKQAVQLGLDWK